ncbi:MFS transporter [Candidatus Profftia tarda]|nr:MFS transporter [Candidatus Profftia tarda]
MIDVRMTSEERKAIWGLGTVFSLRMLGMFMVLPVLNTYGASLVGSSKTLIGVAIGIYGLTQAIFQIPFGLFSDYIGRKPLIIYGLIIFALGSSLAAMTNSIWGVIIGRCLQGSGAISSPIMALLSDLTREQNRARAMAYIGMSLGLTFAISMVFGPIIARAIGLSGLFWIIALLAVGGLIITTFFIPEAKQHILNRDSNIVKGRFSIVLANSRLLPINLGIMFLHILLISSFVVLPPLMENAGLAHENQWKVYLFIMIISLSCVVPCVIYAEKHHQIKRVFQICVILMLIAEIIFWCSGLSLYSIFFGMLIFFIAFNILEALLPSLVSKESPTGHKGTAMGVYSTSQFIGVAIGGSLGGLLYAHVGVYGVFSSCAVLAIIWLALILKMKDPPYLSSIRIIIPDRIRATYWLENKIKNLCGVSDVVLIPQEKTAYIKIDSQVIDREQIESFLETQDSEKSDNKF